MSLEELEDKTKSHILFVYNNLDLQEEAIIDPDMVEVISRQLDKMNTYKKLILILNTRGGNLASGYKIINMIKEKFDQLDVVILGRCGSTGTFMALAADNLYASNSAIITPTEPQMETYEYDNQNISTSVIRNYLQNKDRYPDSVDKLSPITFGKYYATICYFKNLCYNTYNINRVEQIINFMLNEVNSHQMPITKDEFKKMAIELLDIPENLKTLLTTEHKRIVSFLKDKTTKARRHTVIRSKEEISVYEKKYDENKHKIAEGYFIIKEEEFMEKPKTQTNGRITDIKKEGSLEAPIAYKDAYSDSHWDSYNDSYYHDEYADHYTDYGDNSYYHDSYKDAVEVSGPKVKAKNMEKTIKQ